jgi:hypothetical protein
MEISHSDEVLESSVLLFFDSGILFRLGPGELNWEKLGQIAYHQKYHDRMAFLG